jgi:hypothetical protein
MEAGQVFGQHEPGTLCTWTRPNTRVDHYIRSRAERNARSGSSIFPSSDGNWLRGRPSDTKSTNALRCASNEASTYSNGGLNGTIPEDARGGTEEQKYKDPGNHDHADRQNWLFVGEKGKWNFVKATAAVPSGRHRVCYYNPNTGLWDRCVESV